MEGRSIPSKFRELEQLDTDTLKERIRTDGYTEDLDEERILYALRIIASREPPQRNQAQKVDDAWRRFQEEYCTPEGEGQSLYDSTLQLERSQETLLRDLCQDCPPCDIVRVKRDERRFDGVRSP